MGDCYNATYEDKNLKSIIYPDGTAENFSYNPNGYVISFTNRAGNRIFYSKNNEGFLQRKDFPDEYSNFYNYNENGQLAEAWNNNSRVKISYDSENRPSTVEYDGWRRLQYIYDEMGRRIGLSDNTGYNISYGYDSLGRLVSVIKNSVNRKELLNVSYDLKGMMQTRKTGDGTYGNFTFNPRNSQIKRLVNIDRNGNVLNKFELKYNRRGWKSQIMTSSGTWDIFYDLMAQITSVKNLTGGTTQIVYDDNQNRRKITHDGLEIDYVSNKLNQYQKVGGKKKFVYDQNGNAIMIEDLKTKMDERYKYSSEGKFTATSSNSDDCTYEYDALGSFKKQVCTSGSTEFVIDPFGLFGPEIISEVSKPLA